MNNRRLFDLGAHRVSTESLVGKPILNLREKVFMMKNQGSPIGIPCCFRDRELIAKSKAEDVLVAREAGKLVRAIFEETLSRSEEEFLAKIGASEIEWDVARRGFAAPYLLQCVGFDHSLSLSQRDQVKEILEQCNTAESGAASRLRLDKWDSDNCSVLIQASSTPDAIRVFSTFLNRVSENFPVRSWQGNPMKNGRAVLGGD